MDKNILKQVSSENAEVICARIRQDADSEVKILLDRAAREAGSILNEAAGKSEKNKQDILKEAEKEIEKNKERVLSTLNLEKKRLILEGKNKFVQAVFESVRDMAREFRNQPSYPDYLERSIIEGIKVIEKDKVEVFYSSLDAGIVTDEFIKKTENICVNTLRQNVTIKYCKSDFSDLGVIVNSLDGRMMFDNRFLSRLERRYDQFYMELLKEVSVG